MRRDPNLSKRPSKARSRMAWGSPGCSTSRPNGRASAKSSVSPDNSHSIEPVSATSVSVSGKRDSETGENGARTALMDPTGCL